MSVSAAGVVVEAEKGEVEVGVEDGVELEVGVEVELEVDEVEVGSVRA